MSKFVNFGDTITLASNAIPTNPIYKSLMYGQISGDFLGFESDVKVPSQKHLFEIQKCSKTTNTYPSYFDTIKIFTKHVTSIKCGAGTCNQVKDSGICDKNDWQTFMITHPNGRSGRIQYGDVINIVQLSSNSFVYPNWPTRKSATYTAALTKNETASSMTILNEKASIPGSVSPTPQPAGCNAGSCLGQSGKYGQYRLDVQKSLCEDQIFTLWAKNWISGVTSKFTFLRTNGTSFQTFDQVVLSGDELDHSFQFCFRKQNCKNSTKEIRYGDKVQLYSIGSSTYQQCGSGTCSGVSGPGNCGNDWQTFRIVDGNGQDKTGQIVCFDDDIRIRQIASNADVTAAGAGGVWATAADTNENSVLSIQPVSGCIYKDPTDFVNSYAVTQKKSLCERDPLNSECVGGFFQNVGKALGKFFQSPMGIVFSIILAIILLGIAYAVFKRYVFSKTS